MNSLSFRWFQIQGNLFPFLEENIGHLTDKEKKLIAVLEMARIEEYVPQSWWRFGRPQCSRKLLARAFVAKVVYNISKTSDLAAMIRRSATLRQICGWQSTHEVPSDSTFCRSFAEFTKSALPQRVQEALIEQYAKPLLIGHLSRDATDIPAREKAASKTKPGKKTKKKKGRPCSGETRPEKQLTRMERQLQMTLPEMLDELPTACDYGSKKKDGKPYNWRGYKLHVDWADGEIPISCLLTSASLHDSQAAIPLATESAEKVCNLYDLMDAAYDAWPIKVYSKAFGHVPIIDPNPRRDKNRLPLEPAQKQRLRERSTAERGFSLLKECFGGSGIMVKGHAKIYTHLMFSILAITADRLLNLVQ